ncbi:MAG: hypothetical protein M4579_003833 [Chaenotheca gracillima]|nr:MAG: hypothetical protein M4579_003833 [Chaenotheca gracillima]
MASAKERLAQKHPLQRLSSPSRSASALLHIDVRLVIPEGMELPLSADMGFHAMPAVFLLIDLLLFSPPYTISALPAMVLSGFLACSYWLWIEQCYKHNGWYPYPLFEALSPPYRAALFAGSALGMTLSTVTLKWMYGRVNPPRTPKEKPGAAKR